ncbi:hypothetical protein MRB53_022685 [Persea americana]|uniref:Uncharacterized protein n=1 Tax=Persea americana TaxID=3435 RepID=A0ACC2L7N0_PERAE|nr:hypothetical protein MRB53_022685 [Persea americana]
MQHSFGQGPIPDKGFTPLLGIESLNPFQRAGLPFDILLPNPRTSYPVGVVIYHGTPLLLGSILTQIYLRFCSFINFNQTPKDSPLWRRMLELKHHILDHLCWPVGNGEAIDAFQDLWIPGAGPKGCLRMAPSIFIASVISSPGTRTTTLAGTNNSSPAGR